MGTRLGLHRQIVEVDACSDATVLWYIRLQLPSKTVLAQGTGLRVTDGIAFVDFFREELFASLRRIIFFLHFRMVLSPFFAKIVKICDTTKFRFFIGMARSRHHATPMKNRKTYAPKSFSYKRTNPMLMLLLLHNQ